MSRIEPVEPWKRAEPNENGAYTITCKLYDAVTGGNPIGNTNVTSATLAVNGRFDFLSERLGLTDEVEPRTGVFPSTFDFARQALLVVPSDLSESGASDFFLSFDDRTCRDCDKRWSIDARLDNLEWGNNTKTYNGKHTSWRMNSMFG